MAFEVHVLKFSKKKNEKLIKDTLHFDPSDTFIRFSSLKKKGIQEAWNAIYELCDLDFE